MAEDEYEEGRYQSRSSVNIVNIKSTTVNLILQLLCFKTRLDFIWDLKNQDEFIKAIMIFIT